MIVREDNSVSQEFHFLPYLDTLSLGSPKYGRGILLTAILDAKVSKELDSNKLCDEVSMFTRSVYRDTVSRSTQFRINYHPYTLTELGQKIIVIVRSSNPNVNR